MVVMIESLTIVKEPHTMRVNGAVASQHIFRLKSQDMLLSLVDVIRVTCIVLGGGGSHIVSIVIVVRGGIQVVIISHTIHNLASAQMA